MSEPGTTIPARRTGSALALTLFVAAMCLAVSCGREKAPTARETGVLNLLRKGGYTQEDFISKPHEQDGRTVDVTMVLDRMSAERLVAALDLRPYDETSARYLEQNSLVAHDQWRRDCPCASTELDSLGLQSIAMSYGETEGWLELAFTFGEGIASARPTDPLEDVVFTLNAEQNAEVQQRRVFRPTREQLARLREIEPTCPSVFAVITSRWNECKCGMAGVVVWSRPGEIGTAGGRLTRWDKAELEMLKVDAGHGDSTAIAILAGKLIPDESPVDARIHPRFDMYQGGLIMDHDGRLYLDGRLMTDASLDELARARRQAGEITVWLPPLYPEDNSVADMERVLNLAWGFAQQGVRLRVHG